LNGTFIGSVDPYFMKNTLMAVLIITVCCEHIQAQNNPQRTPGYIKYQGTQPAQPAGKRSSAKNTTTDGAVTTDKLANDLFISNITADGTVTTDKLADDILNVMKGGNRGVNANAAIEKLPASVPVYSADASDRQSYAEYMQKVMLQCRYAQSFSSIFKRTGWLQYKVD
jgi:hypothetical protein